MGKSGQPLAFSSKPILDRMAPYYSSQPAVRQLFVFRSLPPGLGGCEIEF